MSRMCDISGKKLLTGHNVSKSNRKINRVFIPNLQNISLKSTILNKILKFKISTKMLRTIMKHGDLDAYLLSARASHLTPLALNLKRKMRKIKAINDA